MIELNEKLYVRAIWFVGGEDKDWMAIIFKDEEGRRKGKYRFRYHKENVEDDKNWYSVDIDPSGMGMDESEKKFDEVAGMTAKMFSGELVKLEINGNGLKALEILSEQEWVKITEIKQKMKKK
jgi:hypothetical protein